MKRDIKKYVIDNSSRKTPAELSEETGLKERKIRKILGQYGVGAKHPQTHEVIMDRRTAFSSKKIPLFFVFCSILIAGLIAYSTSFNNEFLFDDNSHVVENRAIRSFANIPLAFSRHLTYFGGDSEGYFFRPIETVTFMVDYFLWGLDPFGYHLTNALLHIVVALLVYSLTRLITHNPLMSFIISILYLVHPVHTEAVAYVSGRADSISSIFLLSMLMLQRNCWTSNRRLKPVFYLSTLLCYAAGLLTKEVAVVFPLLLVLFEYCMKKEEGYSGLTQKSVIFYVPLLIITATWFMLKNAVAPTEAMVIIKPSLNTRLTSMVKSLFDYVSLSFFPVGLHMEHLQPFPKSLFQAGFFHGFIFVLFLAASVYYLWKKGRTDINYRIMFFGIAWFLLALLPYLNIFFILNAVFAEHWLYIAEIGLMLFAVYWLFYAVSGNILLRAAAMGVCIVAIFSFLFLTMKQNTVWKDERTFYTYTLKHSPKSAKMYNNLAMVYKEKGDLAKAKELLEKAVKISPSYELAKQNLRQIESGLGSTSTR